MNDKAKILLAVMATALTIGLCARASAGGGLKVLEYCRMLGVRCQPADEQPDSVQAELAELSFCCGYDGTPCVPVEFVSSCDPEAEYAVICDQGRTLPSGEIDCFD